MIQLCAAYEAHSSLHRARLSSGHFCCGSRSRTPVHHGILSYLVKTRHRPSRKSRSMKGPLSWQ